MERETVQLLHPGAVLARNDPFRVGLPGQLSAAPAGKGDDLHADRLRRLDGAQEIRRVAAGGEQDEHVALPAERLHLPGEDLVEAEIVADAGQRRAVGGEGDGGQRAPVVPVAADQFLAKVKRVAGAAAVARGEDLAALLEAVGDQRGAAVQRRERDLGGRSTASRRAA